MGDFKYIRKASCCNYPLDHVFVIYKVCVLAAQKLIQEDGNIKDSEWKGCIEFKRIDCLKRKSSSQGM
jgi:hypothetical protein